jgi:hypothetical protein
MYQELLQATDQHRSVGASLRGAGTATSEISASYLMVTGTAAGGHQATSTV